MGISAGSGRGSRCRGGGERAVTSALVVDDEPNIAYLVATSLRLDGLDITPAATGNEASSHLKVARFDVVVLDVMLPDVDGFEIVRRLRAQGDTMPVLFLTAKDQTADRVHGLTIGDDYLTKPFAVEELVARVRLILRRSGSVASNALEVGDLRMDDDAHLGVQGGPGGAPVTDGVQAAARSHGQCRQGGVAGADPRSCVGARLRR